MPSTASLSPRLLSRVDWMMAGGRLAEAGGETRINENSYGSQRVRRRSKGIVLA